MPHADPLQGILDTCLRYTYSRSFQRGECTFHGDQTLKAFSCQCWPHVTYIRNYFMILLYHSSGLAVYW